ncbi:MAG: O-antigen ligase family protein [Acetivibrionales bacterium]
MVKTAKKAKKTTKKNTKKNIPQTSPNREKTIKYFRRALFLVVLIVVFYPPYLRGLFFESQQLDAEIIVFVIFGAFWVYKALKKDRRFLTTPIDYASFGFVVVYLLSIFAAVGLRLAVAEWLKYCMYFAVFFMVTELAEDYKSRITVLWVIIASGTGVALLGLDGAAGGHVSGALNSFFNLLGVKHDVFFSLFEGGRIYSVLQYPNTLAAYLIGVYFIALALSITHKRLWAKLIAGAVSFILLITFIFTLSRGAYLVMAGAAVLYLIVLPKGARIKGAVYAFPSIISAGVVSIKYIGYIQNPEGNELKMWLLVIAGMFLSALLTLAVNYAVNWLERISWKVYAGIIAGFFIAAVTAALLVYNVSAPAELSHAQGEKDGSKVITKSISLQPGKTYRLEYEVEASMQEDKPYAYRLRVFNRDLRDIVNNKSTEIARLNEKATGGAVKRELEFTVPEESKLINIQFLNHYEGTGIKLTSLKVVEAETGKEVKDIVLKRKYIPDSIASRFENIALSNSTIVRAIFYKDGLDIVKDRWLLGAGGGAWSLLYFAHQSYMYWTTQAHNYPLQLAVETGILGIIALLFLLFAIGGMYISNRRKEKESGQKDNRELIIKAALITSIAAMFVHSVLDFDLSLSAVFLMLWQFIALFNSHYRNEGENRLPITKGKLPAVNLSPVIAVFVLAIIAVFPVLFKIAQGYADTGGALYSEQKRDEAVEYIKKAAQTDPFKAEYKVDYANLVIRKKDKTQQEIQEAEKAIRRGYELSKYNLNTLPNVASYYFNTGRIEEGLEAIDRTTQLRPFRPEEWQQRIGAYYNIAMAYFNNKDDDKGLSFTDKTLALIDEAREVNKNNLNPFIFNAETSDMLEKAKYISDMYGREKEIRADRLVFYNMPHVDINMDNVPDQWMVNNANEVKISGSEGKMLVENTNPDAWNYILSREFMLKTGRTYRIEIEFENPPELKTIPYNLIGISEKNGELKPEQDEAVYMAEITVPDDKELGNNRLRLYVKGRYEIKGIRVVEK